MNSKVYTTNSVWETQKIAEKIGETLKGGDIIALYGNLGGGKTTFTQGLASDLGIKRRIISPTFIIVRSYEIKPEFPSKNAKMFYHIDLYRIKTKEETGGLGIHEIIKNKNNIVVIEWAEKMGDLLPKKRIDINFEYIDENIRKIIINDMRKTSNL